MCDIVDLEEALKKTGAELFKELYRVYPVADPEDYFKNGQWRNDLLKADLTLMEAHRREAGAPDVPDIDEITFPKLPAATSNPTLGGIQLPGAVGVAASGQVVEIRLIALFVAKWKLDPVSAKENLSKLTPARRRYVIQHFKTTLSGMEATAELKKFIEECEKDGKWDIAATTTASTTVGATNGATAGAGSFAAKAVAAWRPTITPKISPAVSTPKPAMITPKPGTLAAAAMNTPASGLKRPIGLTVSPPSWAANKRPALATTTAVKPNVISPPKAGAGAVKPNTVAPPKGGATIRPPVRPAGGKLISGLLSNF
jgi:hypothetical protein